MIKIKTQAWLRSRQPYFNGSGAGVRVGVASNLSGIFSHLRDSRSLRELLPAAGCKFQFDAATIKPLVELVRAELKRF